MLTAKHNARSPVIFGSFCLAENAAGLLVGALNVGAAPGSEAVFHKLRVTNPYFVPDAESFVVG